MANELDQQLLDDIEQAVADGANTDQEIADGIGWTLGKFKDWKFGHRKNGEEESKQIQSAIKRGRGRQRQLFLRCGEYSLMKRINGYSYDETTTEEIETPQGTTTKTKTVTKQSEPNMTALIFALVNSNKWRSVNREQVADAIQGKIQSVDAELTDKQNERWREIYPGDYDEFDVRDETKN